MELNDKKKFLINAIFITVVIALLYIAAKFLLIYFLPFIIALIIAHAVQKPSSYLSRKLKIKSSTLAAITSILLYLLIIAAIALFVFLLWKPIKNIFNEIPFLLNKASHILGEIKAKLTNTLKDFSPMFSEQVSIITDDFAEKLRNSSADFFAQLATKTVTKAPDFLFGSLVALVAGCYIAKDYKNLLAFLHELCGHEVYNKFKRIKNILCKSVFKIAIGYIKLSFITFIVLCAGFVISRVKYAIIIAFIIALIDLLPVLGSGIALIPWAIIEFLLGNSSKGVILLVIYFAVILIRNFAEPKIIGNQIGIHPLFTLTAMFLGLKILGFAGLIILPVALIVIIKYYKAELNEEKMNITKS